MSTNAPSILLLGPMRVMRGAEPVSLPQSQKTRGLLAYLVMTRRAQQRERLCEMFWDVTDDPRGALRWSLSKLRALDDPDARRVRADRHTAAFEPAGAQVDALELLDATRDGVDDLPTERLAELAARFRGDFLDGLELDELETFRAWRIAERTRFRELHRALLSALVARLRETPERAVDPARELVRLAPDDELARVALVQLLMAAGRREEAREHYSLGLRQLERSGLDDTRLRDAWRALAAERAPASVDADADVPRQEIRFCKGKDGVRIAYATLGDGPPLVKTANWMSHLQYDWKSPLWRHIARELSRDFQLIRYDQRASGLSDAHADDLSLDACVADLKAVADAMGLERFPLLGVSQGSRVSVAFAVAHPERVSHLILYGGSARGWMHRGEDARKTGESLVTLMRHGWGREVPAFRQVFGNLFMPEASPEQLAWFDELQRASATPDNAARISEASGAWNVTDDLARVQAPTLVMHAQGDAMVAFEEARLLAAGIPGARFVSLESNNHLLLDDEPAFARFLSEIRDFLAEGGSDPRPRGR